MPIAIVGVGLLGLDSYHGTARDNTIHYTTSPFPTRTARDNTLHHISHRCHHVGLLGLDSYHGTARDNTIHYTTVGVKLFLIVTHGVRLYAHSFTWSENLCSLLYLG